MKFFYNILIYLYVLIIRLSSFFNDKALKWIKGRENWVQKAKTISLDNNQLAWFHCSSLGEFEQARPVIKKFKNKFSGWKILITFFSPSGYEVRKDYQDADYVIYLPPDTIKNAKKFLSIIKPKIALFVKYDFWFNYINELYKSNIPIIYFSSIFRKNQYFFKWYGKWYKNQLKKITWFFVQNQESYSLLNSINIQNVTISGDTRFDRVIEAALQAKPFSEIEKFINKRKVLLCGSTWYADEKIIHNIFNELPNDIVLIIAPHNIDQQHINILLKMFENQVIKYSDIKNFDDVTKYKVIVIDAMGFLLHIYKYSYVAYVGGGFGKSIHNILEPAVFGKPVIFGPAYHKFQEAHDLLEMGGAFCVKNSTELKQILIKLLDDHTFYNKASLICNHYVDNQKGATDLIISKIEDLIKKVYPYYN